MRRPPLWLQYVLAFAVAAAVIVGLVRFVQSSTSDQITTENQSAAVQANKEAEVLVAGDQEPHTARLAPHTTARAALVRAIRADMTTLIAQSTLDGPLQTSSCAPAGPRRGALRGFQCTVQANGVSYPFVGVVNVHDRTITYCKRDPPPVPSENVPLSPRCSA
jgi:hypothetical protein